MNAGDTCRLLRHAWERCAPPPDYRGRFRYVLHLSCTRCATVRSDAFDITGHLTHRAYRYPAGYAYAADDVPTTAALRLAMVKPRRRRHLEAAQ